MHRDERAIEVRSVKIRLALVIVITFVTLIGVLLLVRPAMVMDMVRETVHSLGIVMQSR